MGTRRPLISILSLTVVLLYISSGHAAGSEEEATDSTLVCPDSSHATVIDGNQFGGAAYRTIDGFLVVQPWVTTEPTRANMDRIHVRGGRYYHNGFTVNGLSFKNYLSGEYTYTLSPMSVGQLAFSPRPAESSIGVNVGIVTHSGGERFHGAIEAVTDNSIGTDYDQNFYSGYLSGPISILKGASFAGSIERRWLGDRTPSIKTDEFLPGDSKRLPANWLEGWSYSGRIDYAPDANKHLMLSGDGSVDDWQEYLHEFLYQPEHSPRYKDENYGFSANWRHRLSDKTSYHLMAGRFRSERIMGDGVIFDDLDSYVRSFVNPEYDVYNIFREGNYLNASDLDPSITPGSPADTLVYVPSYYDEFVHYIDRFYQYRTAITHRLNQSNEITINANYRRHTVRYFNHARPTATSGYSTSNVDRYGFDSLGVESDSEGYENEAKHPSELAITLADRYSKGNLTAIVSVTLQHFDPDALTFADPDHPFGPIMDSQIDSEDLIEMSSVTRVSPALSMSIHPNERTTVYGSFGKYYQMPRLADYYVGWDYLEARIESGSYLAVAPTELTPEEVLAIDLAVQHKFGKKATAEICFFDNEYDNLANISRQATAVPFAYTKISTGGEASAKGFSLRLQLAPEPFLHLWAEYTAAEITGNVIESSANIAWSNATDKVADKTLNYDRTHTLIGNILFDGSHVEGTVGSILKGLKANLLVRLSSGLPYTPSEPFAEVLHTVNVSNLTGDFNSERIDNFFSVDLKIEKSISISEFELVPFLWVKNLFDHENINHVYRGTGEADNTGYLDTAEGQSRGDDFSEVYRQAERNPTNYAAGRQIFFGLRAIF